MTYYQQAITNYKLDKKRLGFDQVLRRR